MVSRCKVQGWGGPNCRMQKTLPMQSKLRLWHFAKHSRSAAKVYVLLSTMNHSCSPSVRLDTCAESGAEALQVRDNALFGTPTSAAFVPGIGRSFTDVEVDDEYHTSKIASFVSPTNCPVDTKCRESNLIPYAPQT